MSDNRRSFLKTSTLAVTAALFSQPIDSLAQITKSAHTLASLDTDLVIYHSAHLNGEIEHFKENTGGIKQLKKLLDKQEDGGLLLDAGNFLGNNSTADQQYSVVEAMNKAGYHVSTPGVQELAQGEDNLAQLMNGMQFDLVNCNYQFSNQYLTKKVKTFQVIRLGKLKIGITGVGPQIDGIRFSDPVKSANKIAAHLKNELKCDFVICLSGLDYRLQDHLPDNTKLAENAAHIDFIVGSSTHKLAGTTAVLRNSTGNEVYISNPAPKGVKMGKMTFAVNKDQIQLAGSRHMISSADRTYSHAQVKSILSTADTAAC